MTKYKSGFVEEFKMNSLKGLELKINNQDFLVPLKNLPPEMIFSLNFAFNHKRKIVYSINKDGSLEEVYTCVYPKLEN